MTSEPWSNLEKSAFLRDTKRQPKPDFEPGTLSTDFKYLNRLATYASLYILFQSCIIILIPPFPALCPKSVQIYASDIFKLHNEYQIYIKLSIHNKSKLNIFYYGTFTFNYHHHSFEHYRNPAKQIKLAFYNLCIVKTTVVYGSTG